MVDHSPLDCGHVDVGIVRKGLLVAIGRPTILLITRFIEIRLRNKNEGLDGHQDLGGREGVVVGNKRGREGERERERGREGEYSGGASHKDSEE